MDDTEASIETGNPGEDERSRQDGGASRPEAGTEEAALGRLREALIASEPLVAPELVRAGSVTELEESFNAAKAVAQRARDMTLATAAPRISSGAPGRSQPMPATAFDKIRAGLQNRG